MVTNEHRFKNIAERHLQEQPLAGKPLIEILGTSRVLIENHHGICGYSLSEVMIGVRYGQVKITGDQLTLSIMNRESVVVSGCIYAVELIRRENL